MPEVLKVPSEKEKFSSVLSPPGEEGFRGGWQVESFD